MVDHIFCDAEFRPHLKQPTLFNFLNSDTGERVSFDFRAEYKRNDSATNALTEGGSPFVRLQQFVQRNRYALWLSFAAHAEITTMLWAGVDVAATRWIDLMAEARMITSSHSTYRLPTRDSGLLNTLRRLGIATRGDPNAKRAMIDTILATEPGDWPDELWAKMDDYCWSDIEPLPQLYAAIQAIHRAAGSPWTELGARFRGEYVRAVAICEARSRGFPIDVPVLNRIYQHRLPVMRAMAEQVNQTYDAQIYQFNKAKKCYSFNFEGLKQHLRSQDIVPLWDVTPKGRLRTDEKYLDEFVKKNPHYKSLVQTMYMLRHFSSTDLRDQIKDGYIQGVSLSYHASTGRNQPLISRGFILNMQPWLRQMVRPHPGTVLIACDWSQQEIVIAAALSGDQNLKAMLQTGDVYLALAKQAGAIPPEGTKKTHPVQRQIYKSSQLGLGYGMQTATLGRSIYYDLLAQSVMLGIDPPNLRDCEQRASQILNWHKRTFRDFWAWNERYVRMARFHGHAQIRDGWTTFANLQTSTTRLGNFPIQSTGALILRQAVKQLAKHPEIEFVCSLHDAIYILAPQDEVVAHTNCLIRAMTRASEDILALTPMPLPIKIDVSTYDHTSGLTDERDTTTLNYIMAMLDKVECATQ